MTSVVNIRTDDYDVYIGRAGHGLDGTFGNPFKLEPGETRGSTIERFRAYFLERVEKDEDFRRKVLELKGKRLGCFCAPKPCHGTVIAAWLDGYSAQPSKSQQLKFF